MDLPDGVEAVELARRNVAAPEIGRARKIEDARGHTLKEYPARCTQLMEQSTADAVNDILRGVMEEKQTRVAEVVVSGAGGVWKLK